MSIVDPSHDVAAVSSFKSIPTILDIVCRTTGMGFAAVARVTEERWIACSVLDNIAFGLLPGGELPVETTLCHEVRQHEKLIVIDHVAEDAAYRDHQTPKIYGLGSYISIPIHLPDGSFFGTLCAIDPAPHRVNTPETIAMFEMFANMIGTHLGALDRLRIAEADLLDERNTAALREQFIAVLGHDLRNPLTAVAGAFHMIGKTKLEAKAARYVQVGAASAKRMEHLIDDIMDFARGRLGSGIVLTRQEDAPVEAMLHQVVNEFATSHPGRIIESNIDIDESVACDCQRLGQLVSNILGNALTHGAQYKPVRVDAKTGAGMLEISVSNAGDPIPPTVIANIFSPFSRGAVTPGLGGLGLGLYIAQTIATAHGGTISVSSSVDETRFTVRMPTKPLAIA